MDDKELFYDFAKFETQAISQRNSYYLMFESMLFAATAFTADKHLFFPPWLLLLVGFVLSAIWLYMNWLTQVIENAAFSRLESIDTRIRELYTARNKNNVLSIGSVSKISAFAIPGMMTICWVSFLLFYLL